MKLQVPASMAGVSGPCPQCSATIAAPAATPQNTGGGMPTPIPQQGAQQNPPSQQPAQQPATQPTQPAAQQQAPAAQAASIPAARTAPAQPAAAQTPQPQPRPQPSRSEAPARPQGIQQQAAREATRDSLPRDIQAPKSGRSWMRIVFPLMFLLVATVTVLVVLQAAGIYEIYDFGQKKDLKTNTVPPNNPSTEAPSTTAPENDSETSKPVTSTTEPGVKADSSATGTSDGLPVSQPKEEPVEGEFPELKPPPLEDDNAGDTTVPGTTSSGDTENKPEIADTGPSPEQPDASPTTSDQKSPPTAGSRAYTTLTQFLDAKSLEDRLPLMSKSRLSELQLKQSCLAGPLREVKSKVLAEMVPDKQTGMIQYLYFVSFEDPEAPRQRQRIVIQLVERPDVHPPRVHADAFIEHYEKKFQAYSKNPSKDVVTFHCIVEARTADLAKNVPEEVKKESIRLVIKTHPNGTPIFDAMVNKNSPFMERVGAGREFPYTESRFCILSFRWNMDQPDMPYIELNDIVAHGWER